MRNTLYLRPIGAVWGQDIHDTSLLKIGYVAFSHVEIIERKTHSNNHNPQHANSIISTKKIPYTHIADSKDPNIRNILHNLSKPRVPICNLNFLKPNIMGIVNVTNDSFSDGGKYHNTQKAVKHARKLIKHGADIIDIGGESTRPGAATIDTQQEHKRVIPVIEALKNDNTILSCDTRKSDVMHDAIRNGANIINDVSALTYDHKAIDIIAQKNIPVILMHAQGNPETMQDNPHYDNVILDVYDHLQQRINICLEKGIKPDNIIIDPGIGFGKTSAHNLQLIHAISILHGLGVPILLAASRKKFIGEINQQQKPKKRILGSVTTAIAGFTQGVQIARVHDVKQTVHAIQMWTHIHA